MSIIESIQTLRQTKTNIKNALENQGIAVDDDFSTYADGISDIESAEQYAEVLYKINQGQLNSGSGE